jgi:hypothetical protein
MPGDIEYGEAMTAYRGLLATLQQVLSAGLLDQMVLLGMADLSDDTYSETLGERLEQLAYATSGWQGAGSWGEAARGCCWAGGREVLPRPCQHPAAPVTRGPHCLPAAACCCLLSACFHASLQACKGCSSTTFKTGCSQRSGGFRARAGPRQRQPGQ